MSREWNHNIQYHEFVLQSVPADCRQALDAGCGSGRLTHELAESCDAVIGIDQNMEALCLASLGDVPTNVSFVTGDVMTSGLAAGSFDFVAAVATLHHLPLEEALMRFRDLLRAGGVLAVVGLYRAESLSDFLCFAAAKPVSWVLRKICDCPGVEAPMRVPVESLREIRAAAKAVLPGAVVRRRWFYRYTLVWRKG
jgi:SAM-dependent methyltransferase